MTTGLKIQNSDAARAAMQRYEDAEYNYSQLRYQQVAGSGKYFVSGGYSTAEDYLAAEPEVEIAREAMRQAWMALYEYRTDK